MTANVFLCIEIILKIHGAYAIPLVVSMWLWHGLCYKIVNFNPTEAGVPSKWGRILKAVQWCNKNESNCTTLQHTMSHYVSTINQSGF